MAIASIYNYIEASSASSETISYAFSTNQLGEINTGMLVGGTVAGAPFIVVGDEGSGLTDWMINSDTKVVLVSFLKYTNMA